MPLHAHVFVCVCLSYFQQPYKDTKTWPAVRSNQSVHSVIP